MKRYTSIIDRRRRILRGIVLMEVVVSMMVLAVGIVAVSRSFSVALLARGLAQDYTDARFLASQKLSTAVASANLLAAGTTQGGFGEEWDRFSWSQTAKQTSFQYNKVVTPGMIPSVEEMEARLAPALFGQVVVTVSWNRRGETFERSVAALVPPLGELERQGLLVE
jgi:hypothetical protein